MNNIKSEDFEMTLLVADGCVHCADAKSILKDKISSGKVRVGDITKDESARRLAGIHNVNAVPTLILKDKATHFTEACELSSDGLKAICKHKEVEI